MANQQCRTAARRPATHPGARMASWATSSRLTPGVAPMWNRVRRDHDIRSMLAIIGCSGPNTRIKSPRDEPRIKTGSIHEHQFVGQEQHLCVLLPAGQSAFLRRFLRTAEPGLGAPFARLVRLRRAGFGDHLDLRGPMEGVELDAGPAVRDEVDPVAAPDSHALEVHGCLLVPG